MCNGSQGQACGSVSSRSGKRPKTLRRQRSVFPSKYAQPPLVAEEAAIVRAFMEEAAQVEHPAAAEQPDMPADLTAAIAQVGTASRRGMPMWEDRRARALRVCQNISASRGEE